MYYYYIYFFKCICFTGLNIIHYTLKRKYVVIYKPYLNVENYSNFMGQLLFILRYILEPETCHKITNEFVGVGR